MPNQEKLPVWDLSVLYKSIDDPKIQKDAKTNLNAAVNFAKKYRGRLKAALNEEILAALKQLESIMMQVAKLYDFAELTVTTDSQNPQKGVLRQQMMDHYLSVSRELIFFDLELMELPETKIRNLLADKSLADYQHHIAEILKYKPHHLTEEEEKIFNDKSVTSATAFVRLFDQHFASRLFDIKLGNKPEKKTEPEILNLMQNSDRKVRKAAAEAFTKGLTEDKQMLSLIFNTVVKDKAINDQWHKFATPEASRHLANQIDQNTVDAMADTVEQNYGIVEDFYKFKAKVMGLPKLFVYDRYAPITRSKQKYSFAEAKKIVLEAFGKLDKGFAAAAKEFFDKKWIHAPVMVGKRGGAFCSYITPDTHPVVMINYQGHTEDIKTLAHELGHGVNAYMMRGQNYMNFDTPLILAETASVFGEMLVFDALKERITDSSEKFALYVDTIQQMFATVFRQTSMYKFEQDFHKLQKTKGELTTEEINQIWLKRQKEMFGTSLDNSGSDQWWSYVPHFLHTPFYVYAYSFGELLVLSLYAQYKADPKKFVPKYLEMMRAGSSKSPQEIIKPFGFNMADRKFWQSGINIIKELVAEARLIYAETKKSK